MASEKIVQNALQKFRKLESKDSCDYTTLQDENSQGSDEVIGGENL